jgi:hypothetical protein
VLYLFAYGQGEVDAAAKIESQLWYLVGGLSGGVLSLEMMDLKYRVLRVNDPYLTIT